MLNPLVLEKLEMHLHPDAILELVNQLDLRDPTQVATNKKRYRRIRDGTRKRNILEGNRHLNWAEEKIDEKTGKVKENNFTIEYPSISDWINDGQNHHSAKIQR